MPFHLTHELDKTNLILDLVGARQKAISSNLANINTPGYAKQEVNFEAYLDTINKPMETKLAKKMGPNPLILDREDKVSYEEELIAMQKNSLLFSMNARRATLIVQEMKTVSNVGK